MKSKIFIVSTLIATMFLSGSCQKWKRQKNDKILRVAVTTEIPTLDPATAYDTVSSSAIYQSYESLYQYHYLKRPYTLEPLLAAAMPKVEGNGKRLVIKIKTGIRYHDDPAFNGKVRLVEAEDFITQIKRVAFEPTGSTGWGLFEGRIQGIDQFRKEAGSDFNKFKTLSISGLKAIDKETLQVDLSSNALCLRHDFYISSTNGSCRVL